MLTEVLVDSRVDSNKDIRTTDPGPSADRWQREGQLAWSAVTSVPEAFHDAITKDLTGTVAKATSAAAFSFALTCISRQPEVGWVAARVVTPALTIALAKDVLGNARKVADAFVDTWSSDKNWDQNTKVMKDSFGKFIVDFGISSVGGGFSEVAGNRYFGFKTPGVKSLPELNDINVRQQIAEEPGTLKSYRLFSGDGGGNRRVDLFVPAGVDATQNRDLLIGLDSLIINKEPGMAKTNLGVTRDPNIDYIAAFPHAQSFRLLPGVKVSTWVNDRAGLIKPGTWFAPAAKYDDVALVGDVRNTLGQIFPNLGRTTLAGFSSGGTMATEAAAKLGPKVQGVVGVESTVTGAETPAVANQLRLFTHGTENPVLPIAGGAGGSTKMLTALGHDRILGSQPLQQIDYSLKPYASGTIEETHTANDKTEQLYYKPKDGEPVLFVKLKGGKNAWPNRSVGNAEDRTILQDLNGLSEFPELKLNGMIADLVHGRMSVPASSYDAKASASQIPSLLGKPLENGLAVKGAVPRLQFEKPNIDFTPVTPTDLKDPAALARLFHDTWTAHLAAEPQGFDSGAFYANYINDRLVAGGNPPRDVLALSRFMSDTDNHRLIDGKSDWFGQQLERLKEGNVTRESLDDPRVMADLLKQAAEEQSRLQTETGQKIDWPEFYAKFINDKLQASGDKPVDAAGFAQSLKDVASQHHAYETQLGKPDDNWASWYAQHMITPLDRDNYQYYTDGAIVGTKIIKGFSNSELLNLIHDAGAQEQVRLSVGTGTNPYWVSSGLAEELYQRGVLDFSQLDALTE